MEEILNVLQKIQKDLDDHKTAIAKSSDLVTEKVTENINKILNTKFKIYEENQEKLRENIQNQEKRLYILEKQARLRNIVFFGVEENEKSYSNLENIIIAFINNHFSIKLNYSDIQEVRRIGKKTENNIKSRPITVTFTTLGSKIKIMKQKGMLNGTGYYIKEDYPQHILEKRRALQQQVQIEKEKGHRAVIKYDKLVIFNKNEAGTTTDTRKRNLSTSPQNKSSLDENSLKSTQVVKKNKTISQRSTNQRSSSFSEGVIKPGILNYLASKKQDENTNMNHI